jgi:hypothetical protein
MPSGNASGSADAEFKGSQEENVFPFALVDEVGEVSVKGHFSALTIAELKNCSLPSLKFTFF